MQMYVQKARVYSHAWRSLTDADIRGAYETLLQQLLDQHKGNREAAQASCGYVYELLRRVRPDCDPRKVSGCQADSDLVQKAWLDWRDGARWNARHEGRVKLRLGNAIGLLAPALRYVINPSARQPLKDIYYEAERSQTQHFALHECIPYRVRQLSISSIQYKLLVQLLDAMTDKLQSVSKQRLQSVGTLLDDLLFRAAGDGFVQPKEGQDVKESMAELARVTGKQWLQRYGRVYQSRDPVSTDHFRRQIRYLNLLHHKVLNGHRMEKIVPIPFGRGRLSNIATSELEFRSSGSNTSEANSSGSSGTEGMLRHDEASNLRALVGSLRKQCCKQVDPLAEDRVYAFTLDEIDRILAAAQNSTERLVVLLFLSTGVRIGGLARLRWTGNKTIKAEDLWEPRKVPSELVTVEKNGKPRRVKLSTGAKVMVSRVYKERTALHIDAACGYLFPGEGRSGHISTRKIWQICRGIFNRAGLHGAHLHPHTFRHTVVQLLHMKGTPWEDISKWIGHASVQITCGVYGNLKFHDLDKLVQGDDGDKEAGKRAWTRAWGTIRYPEDLYHITAAEVKDLEPGRKRHQTEEKMSRKRQALDYTPEAV